MRKLNISWSLFCQTCVQSPKRFILVVSNPAQFKMISIDTFGVNMQVIMVQLDNVQCILKLDT